MAWFKVDDGFFSSKPVLRIPRRYRLQASGLWLLAGTWSAQEELDGMVPSYVLEELCGTPALAQQLVSAGLWENAESNNQDPALTGWRFRNWSRYQPTKAELDETREKERIRKANYRMSRRDTEGTPPGLPEGHHPESEHPDPTRPDPSPKGEVVPRKRGHRIPNDFAVDTAMVAWAKEHAPAVDGRMATDRFTNHFQAMSGRGSTKLDWVKAWKNWLLSDQQKAVERGWKPTTAASKPMTPAELRARREQVMTDAS